jgi:hypothetical protein
MDKIKAPRGILNIRNRFSPFDLHIISSKGSTIITVLGVTVSIPKEILNLVILLSERDHTLQLLQQFEVGVENICKSTKD